MNLRMLLSVYAVFLGASAAVFLVVPSAVPSMFGVRPWDGVEIFLTRIIGALLTGLGIMCWTARTAEASKARDALILGLTVVSGLFTVLGVLIGISTAANWRVWAAAAFHALVTVLFIVIGRQAMSAPTAGGGAST